MVCEMAGEETKHTGLSTLDALHDATNAFASTTSTAYQETIHKHAAPDDHPYHDLFLQKQRNACVDIQAANGHMQLRSTMGNLMGDRFVPSAFALTYRRSVSRYTAGRRLRRKIAVGRRYTKRHRHFHSRLRRRSVGRPPCRDQPRLHAITRGPQIQDFVVKETGHLSEELAKEEYVRNIGKAEILPRLHGLCSHLVRRELTSYRAGPGGSGGTAPGATLPPKVQGPLGKRSQDRLGEKECPGRLQAVEIRHGLHH